MIVLLLLQIFIGIAKTVFVLKTGQLIDARLILGYYKHLLKLPQQFFDTMRVGEIISRISDAVKIRAFINDVAINIIVNIFIVLFSFGLMFTYFWKLGLIVLAIIPVYALVYIITNQINKKTQRKVMEDAADLESQLVESLNSVSTIKQFGLEDFANMKTETHLGENGAALSGGQKQRIAIARALYKDPEILILDEATSSLDSASEQYVQDAVNYLRKQGKTVILIAHRLSTVFMADKICVLEDGKLIEEGNHKELVSKQSHYYQLWQNQFPFLNGELNSAKLQPQS